MRITKDRDFYKLMLMISLPIGIQNLITFAVSMADTLMLGSLGEVQLSAASIGNNLFFILMVLMFGIGGGSGMMISQYYGKGEIEPIHKILGIMYRVCFAITTVFIIIASVFPKEFISIFTTDELVIAEGVKYLRLVCIGYLFYSLTNCTIMTLRSVKTVNIAMIVYSISLLVNIFFNWMFIFGNLGAPAMGAQGAAVGTVIARITEFIIIIIYMLFFEKKIVLRPKHFIGIDKLIFKDYVKNCTPVLCNEFLWSMGASMISVVVGRMGTSVVAANSINTVSNQFVTVFIMGLSSAASVITGNTIGEGKKEKVKEYAFTIGVFSFFMGLVASSMIYLGRGLVVDLYNVSQYTKNIAMNIMSVTSIIVIFQSVASNLMMGVLRGGGDAKFVLINDIIFMWLVAIPFGFMAAFVWELNVVYVFFIIKTDEILKTCVSIFRVISGRWVKDITRNFEEIETC